MNETSHEPAGRNFITPSAQPVYFRSGDRSLFGWHHQVAHRQQSRLGVVICNPFGYEAICAHRSIRTFAEAISDCGFPTIRFDYSGTGDSEDLEPYAEQLEPWTDDLVAAVDFLRHRSGVDQVCLIGIRLGSVIAYKAALRMPGVCNLAMIAPIIKGSRYVKELRTTRLASMLGSESVGSGPNSSSDSTATGKLGGMEVSGFFISELTLQSLAHISLGESDPFPPSRTLVIDGAELPYSRAWVETMVAAGSQIDYRLLPGLVHMTMTAPQFAAVPSEILAAIQEWLPIILAPSTNPQVSLVEMSEGVSSTPLAEQLELRCHSDTNKSWVERPMMVGTDSKNFVVVTEPSANTDLKKAIILLNAGADHHIGANRMYVNLARRWASRGYHVFRMDFSGIGDSESSSKQLIDDVFPKTAIDEVRNLVQFVHSRYTISDITLIGLCSGAYHALRAAICEVPIKTIILINPQNYFWNEGMTVNDMQAAELVRNPNLYRNQLFSLQTWRRLLTGQIDIRYVIRIYVSRTVLALESLFRDFARKIRVRLPQDLGWELETVVGRGVRVVFIFARGEPGIELLRLQAGSAISRLASGCRVCILDQGDHVFSKSADRAKLDFVLEEELL